MKHPNRLIAWHSGHRMTDDEARPVELHDAKIFCRRNTVKKPQFLPDPILSKAVWEPLQTDSQTIETQKQANGLSNHDQRRITRIKIQRIDRINRIIE